MKNLKFAIELSSCVKIYVPATSNVSETIDNSEKVNETLAYLSKLFGGATATKAIGGWICDSGKLVKEATTIVYSFCTTEQLEQHGDAIIDYMLTMKHEMAQEAVSLEINGKLYLL